MYKLTVTDNVRSIRSTVRVLGRKGDGGEMKREKLRV